MHKTIIPFINYPRPISMYLPHHPAGVLVVATCLCLTPHLCCARHCYHVAVTMWFWRESYRTAAQPSLSRPACPAHAAAVAPWASDNPPHLRRLPPMATVAQILHLRERCHCGGFSLAQREGARGCGPWAAAVAAGLACRSHTTGAAVCFRVEKVR
jgi:hypothetical protein